jgi:hypothetical protein
MKKTKCIYLLQKAIWLSQNNVILIPICEIDKKNCEYTHFESCIKIIQHIVFISTMFDMNNQFIIL